MKNRVLLTISLLLLTAVTMTACGQRADKVVIINPPITSFQESAGEQTPEAPSEEPPAQEPSQSTAEGSPQENSAEQKDAQQPQAEDPAAPADPAVSEDPDVYEPQDPHVPDEPEKLPFESYFENSLFIGDSRSVGLMEYGKIPKTTSFCKTGLSSFNYDNEDLDVKGYGKISFEKLLETGSFDRVYIGLGINELGYEMGSVISQFEDLIQMISGSQPNAKIYILANIHVAKKRSVKDKIFNNGRIDTLNDELKGLCDGRQVNYIDANHLFDDEEGNLRADYTGDNTHLYGKCYPLWSEYIYENSI